MSEICFKFQIGDHVIPVVVAEAALKSFDYDGFRIPDAYRVTMRMSEECVAGVQLSYMIAPWNGGLNKQAEEALMPINDFYDLVLAKRSGAHVKK